MMKMMNRDIELMIGNLLEQLCSAASGLNALQLSIGQSLDVAVHRVVHDSDLGSHDEELGAVGVYWIR
jgi:hypothetical protein